MSVKVEESNIKYDDTETGNGFSSKIGGSHVKLKRELGLFSAINLILGVMIGSGIFISPAAALEHSGSVGLCLVMWAVSGVISLLGALSFAELGTVVGKSGAEYSYFEEAFGKIHKFWGPLPSFSCAWIYVVILRPAEVAVVVMTFAAYATQPFTTTMNPADKANAIKLASLTALLSSITTIKGPATKNRTLRNQIDISKEAQSKPAVKKQEVLDEHIQRAKEKFLKMKMEIQGLLQSLFPHCHEALKNELGELMKRNLDAGSDAYVPVTSENHEIIELLRDLNIVTTNPYDNMQVKLTYF